VLPRRPNLPAQPRESKEKAALATKAGDKLRSQQHLEYLITVHGEKYSFSYGLQRRKTFAKNRARGNRKTLKWLTMTIILMLET